MTRRRCTLCKHCISVFVHVATPNSSLGRTNVLYSRIKSCICYSETIFTKRQLGQNASAVCFSFIFLFGAKSHQSTMVKNSEEYRLKYWATQSSVRSFARPAYSFACSRLLPLLVPSAALNRLLTRSLCLLLCSWDSE